jgi:type VI secretion system protein VasD
MEQSTSTRNAPIHCARSRRRSLVLQQRPRRTCALPLHQRLHFGTPSFMYARPPSTARFKRGHAALVAALASGACACALTGCETAANVVKTATVARDKTLEFTGLKTPEVAIPEASLPVWRIPLRIQASPSLNIDGEGHSLALVLRVYKLRNAEAFLNAPYSVFGDPAAEKERLGEDLVELREIQLVPGQVVDTLEKVRREAPYVGVVALYVRPSPQRWKLLFDTPAAQLSGITVAAHACALSVSRGEPMGPAATAYKNGLGPCPQPAS